MTPKKYFLTHKTFVSTHNAMLENAQFQVSADYAMLQMQENLLGSNASGDKALSNYHMMAGARIFLQVFKGLGRESETAQPAGLPDNLTH